MDFEISSLGFASCLPYLSHCETRQYFDFHFPCADKSCWCSFLTMNTVFSIGEISNLKVKTRRMAMLGKWGYTGHTASNQN